jgi:hypothetical protein
MAGRWPDVSCNLPVSEGCRAGFGGGDEVFDVGFTNVAAVSHDRSDNGACHPAHSATMLTSTQMPATGPQTLLTPLATASTTFPTAGQSSGDLGVNRSLGGRPRSIPSRGPERHQIIMRTPTAKGAVDDKESTPCRVSGRALCPPG